MVGIPLGYSQVLWRATRMAGGIDLRSVGSVRVRSYDTFEVRDTRSILAAPRDAPRLAYIPARGPRAGCVHPSRGGMGGSEPDCAIVLRGFTPAGPRGSTRAIPASRG